MQELKCARRHSSSSQDNHRRNCHWATRLVDYRWVMLTSSALQWSQEAHPIDKSAPSQTRCRHRASQRHHHQHATTTKDKSRIPHLPPSFENTADLNLARRLLLLSDLILLPKASDARPEQNSGFRQPGQYQRRFWLLQPSQHHH